jgi:hypothetical protein
MKSLILVLVTLFISSCASIQSKPVTCHHYGIQVDSESYDDRYIRGVSYLPSVMNPKIYAWGCFFEEGQYFKLEVYNKSNNPINSNYFLDKFELFTKDDKKYILEPRGGIVQYPEKKYINPDDSIVFKVKTAKGLKREDDVSKIVIRLGYDTRIVLKQKTPKIVE